MSKPCPCGSGKPRYDLTDAKGIFCSYVCEDCEEKVMKKYRIEVFQDEDYTCDEQNEPEDY